MHSPFFVVMKTPGPKRSKGRINLERKRLLTYLIEEKLLSDSSQFLVILEDSYKADKLSLDQAPDQGYLCLVTDKQVKNGIGYLTAMTQQDLESYLAPYKAIILKEGIDREVKERIRS